jgi:hypothetical protein
MWRTSAFFRRGLHTRSRNQASFIGLFRSVAERKIHGDVAAPSTSTCWRARAVGGGYGWLIATVEDPEAIRPILAALAESREREGRAPPGAAVEPPRPAVVLGA